MTPETWKRVGDIVDAALAAPAAERESILDRLAGEPELRHLAARLVVNATTAPEFLEHLELPSLPFAEDDAPVFAEGDLVAGRFRVVRFVAAGGMGEVYVAEDETLSGERLALKVLRRDLWASDASRRRMEREIKLGRRITHPHACRVFDFGHHESGGDGTIPFVTMEFLEGVTLSSEIERGPLAPDRILAIGGQIAGALDAAHAAGVIHRDLKASNVMLVASASGGVRASVTDFGIAAATGRDYGSGELTGLGQAIGTPGYMAPEVLKGGAATVKSDIHAFGVLLFEMATGRRPFVADSTIEVAAMRLRDDPPRPSSVCDSVPPGWDDVLLRCLARDPDERFESASAVIEGLEDAATTPPKSPAGEMGRPLLSPRRVRVGAALTLALTLVVATVAVIGDGKDAEIPAGEVEAAMGPARVAVLPFQPLDGLRHPYLTEALQYELTSALAQLDDLRIVPSASDRAALADSDSDGDGHRDRHGPATHAVRGSIGSTEATFDLRVELVQLDDDTLVWSTRYERDLKHLGIVQEVIAQELVQAMAKEGLIEPAQLRGLGYAENARAHLLYLEGRESFGRRTVESVEASLSLFQQALEEDPEYALAHVGVADAYQWLGAFGARDGIESRRRAKAAALHAMSLDGDLAEAHATYALLTHELDWDWYNAERSFLRALEAKPGLPSTRQWYAYFLVKMGRLDEAVAQSQRALALDPFSVAGNWIHGWMLVYGGRLEQALSQVDAILAIEPGFAFAYSLRAEALARLGRFEPSLADAKHAVQASNGSHWTVGSLAAVAALAGERELALENVRELERRRSAGETASAFQIATAYAALGEHDRCFEWLEIAYDDRESMMLTLRTSPIFAAVREDSRYPALVERFRLPEPEATETTVAGSAHPP